MDVENYSKYELNSIIRFNPKLKIAGGRFVNTLYISTKVSFGKEKEAYTEITGGTVLPFNLRKNYSGKDFEELETLAKIGHNVIKQRISNLERNKLELDKSIIS